MRLHQDERRRKLAIDLTTSPVVDKYLSAFQQRAAPEKKAKAKLSLKSFFGLGKKRQPENVDILSEIEAARS